MPQIILGPGLDKLDGSLQKLTFSFLAKLAKDGVPEGLATPMIVGIITSAVSGWLAVWGVLRLVRTRSFAPFVLYRIELAVLVFALMIARIR